MFLSIPKDKANWNEHGDRHGNISYEKELCMEMGIARPSDDDVPANGLIGNNSCWDSYMTLSCDVSGSRTKNRFRNELLWGIDRILDSLSEEDFAVVFDYLCDIEVILPESISFYQVKTSTSHYTVAKLCSSEKGKPSIVAKLYDLRNVKKDSRIRLAVVSNAYLKCIGDKLPAPGEVSFLDLDHKDQDKIEQSIEQHCGERSDLSNLRYIYVAMDLNQPDDVIKGRLISEFITFRNCEPVKPNALYDAVKGMVEEKACCETIQASFTNVIKNKAITKREMNRLFSLYEDKADPAVEKTAQWVDTQPFAIQGKMHRALAAAMYEPIRPSLETTVVNLVDGLNETYAADEALGHILVETAHLKDAETEENYFSVQIVLATFRYLFEGSKK